MKIKHDKMDLAKLQNLSFFEPDEKKFPALRICREVMEVNGSAPAVLNAANEVAVERFLKGEISFDKISEVVEKTLTRILHKRVNSIAEVLEFDQEARNLAKDF